MSHAALERELGALAQLPGLLGCALVDAATGMIWHAKGIAENDPSVGEAAIDFWRLSQRRATQFHALGELRAQVIIHASGRITLAACGPELVLVTLSAEPDRVAWDQWKTGLGKLRALTLSL